MIDCAGAGFGCAWLASAGRRPLKGHSGSATGRAGILIGWRSGAARRVQTNRALVESLI